LRAGTQPHRAGAQAGGRLEDAQGRDDIDAVLDELERRKLLSEERFAASVLRTRSARYGEMRLARDLRVRGVPADVARSALNDPRLESRARAQWSRHFDRFRQPGRVPGRRFETRGFGSQSSPGSCGRRGP
jgi:regulatory protein